MVQKFMVLNYLVEKFMVEKFGVKVGVDLSFNHDLDFDKFQDCSCACKECGDLAKDCKPCRLVISTHFRYVCT